MAPGCPAYRPTVPALCPLHDQPQRTPGEDPAHPHISAEHPQQLELPLLITTINPWTLKLPTWDPVSPSRQVIFLLPSDPLTFLFTATRSLVLQFFI